MKHFSRNLLISSTNSSIQLVQIVHKHSTESEVEVLSVSEDQLIFSNVRDYDIKCKKICHSAAYTCECEVTVLTMV